MLTERILASVRHCLRMTRLLGVAGALLFVTVVVISLLAVRASQAPPAIADGAAGSGPAPTAPRIANMAPLRFGPEYAARSASISPDGKLATAMTTDWSAEGVFALSDDPQGGFITAREIARVAPGVGQMAVRAECFARHDLGTHEAISVESDRFGRQDRRNRKRRVRRSRQALSRWSVDRDRAERVAAKPDPGVRPDRHRAGASDRERDAPDPRSDRVGRERPGALCERTSCRRGRPHRSRNDLSDAG